MERKKVFHLDGGAGRVICALPALEKYAKKNPDKDFNVIIGGWDTLTFGNRLLQDKTYSMDVKGIFNLLINSSIGTSNQKLVDNFFALFLIELFKKAPPPIDITELFFFMVS